MKIIVTILIFLKCAVSMAQYTIDKIYVDGNTSDTTYTKVPPDDSVFRLINGSYQFAFKKTGKEFISWSVLQNKPSSYTPSSHSHVISEVTSLQSSLNNKADLTHNHGISDVVNLQSSLDDKSTIYFGIDAQSNDNYVITASPVPPAYTTGMVVIFKAKTANTTGCAINVNGLGSKTIVKRVSTTMATGDILAGMFCMLVYDGVNFVIMNPVVN